ncbi:MAG: PilZ domain-containing protein [Candidatus Omnitrophica bacterium]|nr:PilZ domain-containing protein [Candidatus Omnitrophota bacterium]
MTNERRKYVRLNKIFPVELKIVDSQNKPLSDLLQGFTRDVSFFGVCVEINSFKPEHLELLKDTKNKLQIFLNIPLKNNPVKAIARIAWSKKTASPYPESCMLGLAYEAIDSVEQKRIISFAKFLTAIPRMIVVGCLLLLLFCGFLAYDNIRLNRNNNLLVEQLSQLSDEQFIVNQELDKIKAEKLILAGMMNYSAKAENQTREKLSRIEALQKQQLAEQNTEQVEKLLLVQQQLKKQLAVLSTEKQQIESRLNQYTDTQIVLETKLEKISNKRVVLEDKTLDLMRQWLLASQSSKTGLIVSYDNDHAFIDVGFTYDQALSAFNFINFKQYEKAELIFDFFNNRAKKVQGGFANAYDVITGNVSEYIVHTGPVIYLGLALMRYEQATGKTTYKQLVSDIADWLLELQNRNKDGSLPGGPQVNWAGTEQNIAAYMFFKKLFKESNDQRYALAARKVYKWLKDSAYNKTLKRFNRGTDDRMIATDTVALSIMAFGPQGLEDMGVAVDDLLACVEENCKTTINIQNIAGKKVKVSGFDFCASSSISRGGTISVEWTAQMVVALCQISSFYKQQDDQAQASKYQRKADYYLGELEKLMLIRAAFGSSKGRGGLPYASNSAVDTGHGWYTPDSGSISAAGTNFAIFAKEEYNIF